MGKGDRFLPLGFSRGQLTACHRSAIKQDNQEMANKTGAQFFPNLTVEVTLNVICSTLFLSESILQTAVQEEIVQGFAF